MEVRQLMRSVSQTSKRAVLYERVSTEEQAKHGYSIGDQLDDLRKHAKGEDYVVVGEFSDPGDSGLFLERPGLDALRERVAAGGVDLVLVRDRDRIAREPAHIYILQQEFARTGAKMRALNARDDDTPENQLANSMLDQLAKYEQAKIAERTRRGRLAKARRGGLKIGRIPKYGYAVNEMRDGYVIDEETIETVCRIIRLVATGHSLHGLKRVLEAEGVSTPGSSKTWNRTFLRKLILDDAYLPHSYAELQELVSSEVLARLDPERHYGIVWHNRHSAKVVEKIKTPDGYKLRRKFTERPRGEWIAVPIPAPPCVDRETVERARAQIAGNYRPARNGARVWELSGGILYCGHCSKRMIGQNQPSTRSDGTRVAMFYYACQTKINESAAACEQRYHRAEPLEELVANAVGSLLADPTELLAKIDEKIEEEERIARDPRREIASLSERLEVLAIKRERFLDLYAEGHLTKPELGRKLSDLDTERAELELAIEKAADRQEHIERWRSQKRTALTMYEAFAAQAPTLFTPEARRAMYERLGLRVTVYRDQKPEVEITLDPNALPAPEEAEEAFEAAWRAAMSPERESIETLEFMPEDPTCS
jgi:site-specific DNA recombinase